MKYAETMRMGVVFAKIAFGLTKMEYVLIWKEIWRRRKIVNTDVMFSSKTDLWETPREFFDRLNDEFSFNLDACALPENAKCD